MITAGVCAYLGVFVMLRRIVFVSIALSEVAALGVALGFFLGIGHMVAAFTLTIAATMIFWLSSTERNLSREGIVAFVYCFCAALSVIFLSKNPMVESSGIDLISGNFLYATTHELTILTVVSSIVVCINLLFRKEFIAVAFDRDFAFSVGVRAKFWDFLFYMSLGIIISFSMKISGIIFVFASMVIPALTGLAVRGKLKTALFVSVISALFCSCAGFFISYRADLPSAPAIVVLMSLVYVITAIFAVSS